MSFNYDQSSNYTDEWLAGGTNTRSVDGYFLANAQGLRLDQISAFPDITDDNKNTAVEKFYNAMFRAADKF